MNRWFRAPVAVLCTMFCVVIGASATARATSPVDDDFEDGVRGPQWTSVIDLVTPQHLNLAEENGHLNVLSPGGGVRENDALYLSTFRLSTATDFKISLAYSFITPAAAGPLDTALGLVFGVGADTEGLDSVAIGQGWGRKLVPFGNTTLDVTAPAATVGYRTDDHPFGPDPTASANVSGTFEISYVAADDALTLREIGGLSYVLNGTVRGVWNANDLLVSFGGEGSGFVTNTGQAYVDNFAVVSGTIVPEPACLTAMAVGGLALRRRRINPAAKA